MNDLRWRSEMGQIRQRPNQRVEGVFFALKAAHTLKVVFCVQDIAGW